MKGVHGKANGKQGYNTLLARRQADVGHPHSPEDPKVFDMVHGMTSKTVDDKVTQQEDAIVKKRRQPGKHIGYDPLPTPQLGRRTRSMRQNVLLQKPELGRSASTGTKNMQNMAHGLKTHKVNTAAQAMNTWHSHSYSRSTHAVQAKPQLDYVEMNRRALGRGLVTPREQLSMRQSEAVYRRPKLPSTQRKPDNRHVQSMTHGKPSGWSTSVAELMTSMHGDQWLAERRAAQERERERAQLARRQGYAMTRTAILRQKRPEGPPQPLWRMKKFDKAKPKLQTFRTQQARDKSMEQQQLLGTDRVGATQQGLPQHLSHE